MEPSNRDKCLYVFKHLPTLLALKAEELERTINEKLLDSYEENYDNENRDVYLLKKISHRLLDFSKKYLKKDTPVDLGSLLRYSKITISGVSELNRFNARAQTTKLDDFACTKIYISEYVTPAIREPENVIKKFSYDRLVSFYNDLKVQ